MWSQASHSPQGSRNHQGLRRERFSKSQGFFRARSGSPSPILLFCLYCALLDIRTCQDCSHLAAVIRLLRPLSKSPQPLPHVHLLIFAEGQSQVAGARLFSPWLDWHNFSQWKFVLEVHDETRQLRIDATEMKDCGKQRRSGNSTWFGVTPLGCHGTETHRKRRKETRTAWQGLDRRERRSAGTLWKTWTRRSLDGTSEVSLFVSRAGFKHVLQRITLRDTDRCTNGRQRAESAAAAHLAVPARTNFQMRNTHGVTSVCAVCFQDTVVW